jgi:hypothetical protein
MSLSEASLSGQQGQKAPRGRQECQALQDLKALRVPREHLYIQSRCVAAGVGRAGVTVRAVKLRVRLRPLPLPGAL